MKVALLHALPLDERMWESQLDALSAAGHEPAAPRLYELGSSMDEWARAILDRVEGRFAAVGASMGGYVALAIARRAPERLAGLVLVGSRAEADAPERRPTRERWLQAVAADGAEGLWREMHQTVFPGLRGQTLERVRAMALGQDPEGLAQAITAIRDRDDAQNVVASLACPLLVAAGDGDPLVSPEVARRLADSAAEGRTEIFEGAGHLPSVEQPDRFERLLLDFLAPLS